jgi:DNA invertase Pin-like site-specific DNA recombinase
MRRCEIRAGIYARVSTAEQVDGTSLGTQVDRCRAHAIAQGWEVVSEWIDEGVSGAKASRPALDRLLRGVRASEVDVVVVAKLDRIGRSMRHLAALLGELDDRGIALVSVSESFDSSTPAGRLQRNMLGSFAEFEREQIRERSLAGLEASVRQGRWAGGPPPFGFKRQGHQLVIDEREAETLRLAIRLFVEQRMTMGQVASELNARGLHQLSVAM